MNTLAKPRHDAELAGYGYLCVLAVLLAYLSATIGSQLSTNIQVGLLVHLFRLYSQPLLLAVLLVGLLTLGSTRVNARMFLSAGALIAAGLIYAVVDLAHYGIALGVFRATKDVFYNKITSSYLVAILVFAILTVIGRRYGKDRTWRALIVLPTVFAFCSLVLWAIARTGLHSFSHLEITHNNAQAYESSAVLLLLLFLASHIFSPAAAAGIVIVHGLVPLLHHSRGGMIVELVVLASFLWSRLRHQGVGAIAAGTLEKSAVVLSILLVAGLTGLLGGPSASETQNRISVAHRVADLMRSSALSRNFQSNSEISTDDDVVSAYSRIGTTLLALKAFAKAPITGIGIWNAYSDIQVANFGIHGLWPLLMAAYGILGLIPVALVFAVLWSGESIDRPTRITVVLLILLVGLVFNRYPWWLGGLLWAFSNRTDA